MPWRVSHRRDVERAAIAKRPEVVKRGDSDGASSRRADWRFPPGRIDYSVAWILLTFLGLFGVHRMYLGKWFTDIVYLLSAGLFGLGYLYDYWTLNGQIDEINRRPA